MGEILLAQRQGPAGFEKLVVLKRPLQGASRSPGLVGALIAEARLLARINHPNVCQVFDLEEADGEFLFSMEYLQGLSMWTLLVDAEKTNTPLDPLIACGLFEQICDGLNAIHGLRADGSTGVVVHRDISPGNLFVTESGVVKILDLGIAKSNDAEERTPYGLVKGKMSYVSPEQVSGLPYDGRADLFSLGLVLYDLARGRRPPRERIGALVVDKLELDAIPAPIAAVIRRTVTTSPQARYTSASEMAAALRTAGAALGGAKNHGEVGFWLTTRFGRELTSRADGIRDAIANVDLEDDTQIINARSASPDDSAPIEPTSLRTRETEELMLPASERLALRSDTMSTRKPRSVVLIAGVAMISAIAVVALALGLRADPPDTSQPSTTPAVVPPSIAPTPPVAVDPPRVIEPRPEPSRPKVAKSSVVRPHVAVTPSGRITVDSQPWATVRLGTHELGNTPIWKIAIAPGVYHLHAETGDGRKKDMTVKIAPLQTQTLLLNWGKP
jgi:eukaryotic-like serine/threonine-protein kinase